MCAFLTERGAPLFLQNYERSSNEAWLSCSLDNNLCNITIDLNWSRDLLLGN